MAGLLFKRIDLSLSTKSQLSVNILYSYYPKVASAKKTSSTLFSSFNTTLRCPCLHSSCDIPVDLLKLKKFKICVFQQKSSKLCSSQRFLSSKSGSDDQITKLPKRLVKRLEKQGVSEQDFLSRLKTRADLSSNYHTANEVKADQHLVGSRKELDQLLKTMTTEPKFLSPTDSFPSDQKKFQEWQKHQSNCYKPKVSPSLTSVVLFPGQGSQFVGMGSKLIQFPGVKELFEEASAIVGYDLLKLCLHGPKSELDKTVHCQPAVMITSLAAIEKFREEHPQAIDNCVATAGFSVGEFAALVFSGVLSFPDAVKVVKLRAEAMQKASEHTSSAMLTVFLAHDSKLKEAIKMAKDYCVERRDIPDPVCTVANFLFPECKVLAGHEEAIEFIATNAKEFRLLRTKRLPVSGAFHTRLMQSAVKPVEQALTNIQLAPPKIPVYSNVTSAPYHAKANYSHLLGQQLVRPVRWEQILHTIYGRPQGVEFPHSYEMGPGRQMGTLLRQVNAQAYKQYHNIDV